ncbi:MAG: DUF2666 family protein [Candidatus Diapherotrites archaeon]|nr:DUF2666 family protein [Candidatus Diapherotrites archaeon]
MDKIEFFAQVGKWVAVKKMKIDEHVQPIEVCRFLVSVHETLDRKIWEFLSDDFDLKALEKIAADICGAELTKKGWQIKGRLSEEKINQILAKLKSPTTSKAINQIVKSKRGKEIAKTFVTRKVLEILGYPIELESKQVEKYIDEKRLQE